LEWVAQFEGIAREHHALALLLAYAGGVLASFTPCTYPMMPITVAFVGAKANGSRWRGFVLAFFYVFGLAIVYSALGAFAALTGELFGALTANWWTYLFVGNICLVFGLAMLEVIPLTPPAFLNRVQVKNIQGHDILSSVILGGASALVISTCTTPILGVLLTIVATQQDIVWGIGMLFAFSFGIGSFVILLGTFAGLLTSLPRSGPWMRRIQKAFGLLMILAAEYFFIRTGELWL
jgi:thiol:disulfide interchange protein DsbD